MTFWNTSQVAANGLEWIRANATRIVICDTAPDSFAEANTTTIAGVVIAGAKGSGTTLLGAFAALADGSSNAVVLTIPQSSENQVFKATTGTHVALTDTGGSILIYVTQLETNRSVTTADKLNVPEWTITVRPPTAS
jgi:hypothetical protein